MPASFELCEIRIAGDRECHEPPADVGGCGAFVTEPVTSTLMNPGESGYERVGLVQIQNIGHVVQSGFLVVQEFRRRNGSIGIAVSSMPLN